MSVRQHLRRLWLPVLITAAAVWFGTALDAHGGHGAGNIIAFAGGFLAMTIWMDG